MNMAVGAAEMGTCPRAQVGCVLVRDKHIIASGHNGAPPGQPHCIDAGCMMVDNHCVSGDTVVSKFQSGNSNDSHRSIEFIYDGWQTHRGRIMLKRMQIRSVNELGVIVPDRIVDVWQSGKKPMFRVGTRIGRYVTTTVDHQYLTPDGWQPLSAVSIGSSVALNGTPLYEDADWLRARYVDDGMNQLAIAKLLNCCRSTIRSRLDKFGIERRSFRLGGWNTGFRRDENHTYKGPNTTTANARSRSRRYAISENCAICGDTSNLQVHHIDKNVYNDMENNLIALCIKCHQLAHTPHAKRERIVFDTVCSIEPVGKKRTYDISTEKYHNFVGDGFVLHNCTRATHAEQNAIVQCALHGSSSKGTTCYTTHFPCVTCAKILIGAGVDRVVYLHDYANGRGDEFFRWARIQIEQLKVSE